MNQENYTAQILGTNPSPDIAGAPRLQLDSLYSGKGKKGKEYKKLKKEYKMLVKAYKELAGQYEDLRQEYQFLMFVLLQYKQAQPPVIAVEPTKEDGTWWKDTLSRSIPSAFALATACVNRLPSKRPTPPALTDGRNHQ